MRCGLCGFLIIKPQTALHHAVWCGAVRCTITCSAVIPFCGWSGAVCAVYAVWLIPLHVGLKQDTTPTKANYQF